MKTLRLTLIAPALPLLLAGCSGLSDEAKEMIGDYYIDSVSPELPLFELKEDGTCVRRAISPSLTLTVEGTWNALNDSLIIEQDLSTLTIEGDSTLVGNVAPRIAKKIHKRNDYSMSIIENGIPYEYTRRRPRQ